MKESIAHRLAWGAAALLCIAGVPLFVVMLVRTFYGVPITAYRPIINDEVAYWHQALTFSTHAFHGGYYTLDEATNASGLTPFGPHGPGFAVLYGTFGSVFGWYRHSVVMLNLFALAVAGWVWVSCTRLRAPRLLLSAALLLTFWHMIFWAPTGMQEPLHHAGAIVMAALFVTALEPSPRTWLRIAGWIVLAVLAFVRPSWVILFPAWALVVSRNARGSIRLVAFAGSALLALSILFAYSRTAAPYGQGFFFLRAASLTVGAKSIADNVLSNFRRIGMPDQYEAIELIHRYQYAAMLVASAVTAIVAWRRRRARTSPVLPFVVVVFAMGGALAGMLLLYEFTNFAEHRILSAFLLFGALLCLATPGRIGPLLAGGLIASNLAVTATALRNVEAVRRDAFVWDRRGVFELEDAIAGKLVYRRDAPRWCNTLLAAQYPPHLIAIPAGIGLSVVRKPELFPGPPRSHYVLLDDAMRGGFTHPLHLDPIATLPYGTLSVNKDAGCP